jgi:hypothetical protein
MTTDRDDIASLLERVRAATEGDNDLDRDVAVSLGWTPPAIGLPYWHDHEGNHWTALPDWSTSIDDALALVDRLLGVDATALCYSYDLGWHASAYAAMAYTADLHLAIGNPAEMHTAHGQATTLPLAILAALLKSLTSLKENHP